jgi:hypothetical protein
LQLVDRYLARNIAVPLVGTLVLAAMLLVLDKMLRLFDFVINAGGPVSVVWRMLANLLPEYFSRSACSSGSSWRFASWRYLPSSTQCAGSASATADCYVYLMHSR